MTLTDLSERVGLTLANLSILATGAVHTHLIRQKLRTFVSLNVRSGECLDVHYFAVLIGVGATTMSALFVAHLRVLDCAYLDAARGLFGESWIVDVELPGDLDDPRSYKRRVG